MKALVLMMSAGILMSAGARADFAGNWKGSGNFSSTTGWSESCHMMSMEISQSSVELAVNSSHIECETISGEMEPMSLELQGSSVFYKGDKVGTITDTELHISINGTYQGEEIHVDVDAVRTGNTVYNKIVSHNQGASYTLEGTYDLQ